jgi:preprotein translocase subunit YajC
MQAVRAAGQARHFAAAVALAATNVIGARLLGPPSVRAQLPGSRDPMFASPAYAQAAGAAAPGGAAIFMQMVPLVLIFVVFYFLLIRPQQKRMKEQRATIDAVKKGDQVVTGGGLIGRVTRVDETEVEIELATNVKVRAIKSTLTDVRPTGGAKPAND